MPEQCKPSPVVVMVPMRAAGAVRRTRGLWWRTLAVPTLAVLASTVLRWALHPLVGNAAPFTLYYPAVMVSASYGGARSGLLATALSVVTSYALFLKFDGNDPARAGFNLVLLLIVGGFISLGTDALQRARRAAEASRDELHESRVQRETLLGEIDSQRAFLDAVIQQMPSGILIAEAPSGRLKLINPQARHLLRHPLDRVDSLADYAHFRAFHPDGTPVAPHEWPLAIAIMNGTITVNRELDFECGDGARRIFRCNCAPIRGPGGRTVAAALTFTDLTPLKEAEADRERLLAAAQSARDDAERANSAKTEFLAMLSHELRNPLNPVLLTANAMEEDETLPNEVRRDAAEIRRNVELETRLIDDLLDVMRVTKAKLRLRRETVDLHDVLRAATDVCGPEAAGKGITIDLELRSRERHVDGDPTRLHQVFWNLLKNACKFTPAAGRVAVRTADAPPGHVTVEVRDTGIGIAADALPRLFDAFEQGTPVVTREYGGLGLGLAIVKAVVEMHGGTVAAASDGPGKGATFSVTLPTVDAPANRPLPREPDRSHGLTDLRILLVEDNVESARTMARLLGRRAAAVRTADSVESARRLAEAERFDLVISDLGLPDGSGLDLMRHLTAQHNLKGIALTGYGSDEDIRRSAEAGFTCHLTKPVTLERLLEAIRNLS